MAGILCSCKVPWRIAVLDGKSVELCPVCGAWREAEIQVQPGLWQEYPKGDFEPRLPTEGGEAKLPRELPSFPNRAAAIRRLRLEAAGCLGVGGMLLVVIGWVAWLVVS